MIWLNAMSAKVISTQHWLWMHAFVKVIPYFLFKGNFPHLQALGSFRVVLLTKVNDLKEAVLRELKEEAGLDGTNPQLLMVMGDLLVIQGSTSSASSTKWRPLVIRSEAMMHKMLVSGPFQRFSREGLCLLAIMVKLLRLGSINQFRANELSKLLTCIRPFWKFKRIGQMQSCQELSMDFFDIIAPFLVETMDIHPLPIDRGIHVPHRLRGVLEHPSRQPHWQR